MARRVGLIAGLGCFPLELARAARDEGREVVAVAIRELTQPSLEGEVERTHWLHLGEIETLLRVFREEGLRDLVMAGKVPKSFLYEKAHALRPDATARALLKRLSDRSDDSILGAVAGLLEAEGFRLLGQAELVPQLLAREGPLGGPEPDPAQWADIRFAWPIARTLGGLDVGQTVVVKRGAVMALEAMEGTDAAIRRGGALGGPGACVLKVAKPGQDPRFDVPVVGPDTVRVLAEVRAAVLAVEAGATVVLERDRLVAEAERSAVAVVGVAPKGLDESPS